MLNRTFDGLSWQRLAAAIAAGNCAAAAEHLDEIVSTNPGAREEVERGRVSIGGKPAVRTFEGPPIVDGVIKDATIYPYGAEGNRICSGKIFGDAKGRFADGERISTSGIINGPDANGIIHTRHSVYRVELSA